MKKYRVGYIAGVFDLFHIGHLNLIRRAKEQCEYLIVGVVIDEIPIRAKGKKPHIPLEERIEIICAVRYVDEAVIVTPDCLGKLAAWNRYHFDCMFSGDDWRGHPSWVREEEQLKSVGADLVFFPYTEGRTSTQLRGEIALKGI